MSELAILTPTHKSVLNAKETLRLTTTLKSCGEAPHFFLVPESLKIEKSLEAFSNSKLIKMPDWFFQSVNHYNVMMLQEYLYQKFTDFRFILVCQTDAMVIGKISDLYRYDYFGASWKRDYILTELFANLFVNRNTFSLGAKTRVSAGNGGLSLRNVEKTLEMIKFGQSKPFWNQLVRIDRRKLNEDVVLSFLGTQLGFQLPNREDADRYFVETNKFNPACLSDHVGFHALEKYQPEMETLLFAELNL